MNSRIRLYSFLSLFFLALSLVCFYFVNKPVAPAEVIQQTSTDLAHQLELLGQEKEEVLSTLSEGKQVQQKLRFSWFLIRNFRVAEWTDNSFVPVVASVHDPFELKLLKEGSSDYLARKWEIDGQKEYLIGVIPLVRRFAITNNYLQARWNEDIFPDGVAAVHDPLSGEGIAVCIDEVCPFRLSFFPESLNIRETSSNGAAIFSLLSILFIVLLVFHRVRRQWIPDLVFLLLFSAFALLRLSLSYFNFPGGLVSGDLFNPVIFASSVLNPSLGDMLLNEILVLILCSYLFRNIFNFRSVRFLQQGSATRWLLSIFASLLFFLGILFPFVVVQTLFNNSSIILNISESLQFEGLRVAATLAIILSGVCSFLFCHIFLRLLIGDENRPRVVISFLFGAVLFVVINIVTEQQFVSSALVAAFHFLLIYFLRLFSTLKKVSFATFTYLFVCIFTFSVNAAWAMHVFSREERIENQFRFARNFLIDRDYFAEYLLGEFSRKVGEDAFIQSRVATPFLSKEAVRHKIRQVFLPSYFNKYDVEIYVFNSAGEDADNRSPVTLTDLLVYYNNDAYRTEYEGVYFINSPAAEITQKYLVVIPVTRLKTITGHVVVEFSLKRVIPETVYPELLVDNRFLQFYRTQEINYALFVNNELSYSSGLYNYEALFDRSLFGVPDLHTTGVSKAGYDHIAVEDENGRIAVVSSRSTSLTLGIANFAFLLVIGLSTILVFVFIQGWISYLEGRTLYFSARIQLFLNLAFFLPLIIVSIMSLNVTNRSSQRQINEEYLNKTRKFSDQVAEILHDAYLQNNDNTFNQTLKDLAQFANLDANVYNQSGLLIATSQSLIFENNLLSAYVNPAAYHKIRNGNNVFIERERVGELVYSSAYASLKAPSSGVIIGIIGIPFFQSVYSSERVQINILANILNIFALIFVVLVALSYFVTRWLTFPLNFITQSLKKTSLTRINQPLVWRADDEIGMMVKEYNHMLFSLGESKAELERTQRERAWREIAQQVAHEIKNPLTPMKLTLQKLERQVQEGSAGQEKIEKAIDSLLSQLNTLNDIASSFSSFAKMPEPVMKPFELVSSLRRIIDLHSQSGEIRLESREGEVYVNGDEQLLGRTFSNLIINAIQAAVPGRAAQVIIRIEAQDDRVRINFSDNGKGMEQDIAERVFLPHFTTKKTGSGLGLAIARQAIEQMNGRIWFDTVPGKGTDFYIELPLVVKAGSAGV